MKLLYLFPDLYFLVSNLGVVFISSLVIFAISVGFKVLFFVYSPVASILSDVGAMLYVDLFCKLKELSLPSSFPYTCL